MTNINDASLDELREKGPHAAGCGSELTWSGDGWVVDQAGHQVEFVHARWVQRALRVMSAVSQLHRVDPEGLIPTCRSCGEQWPCTLRRALDEEQ